MICPGGLNMSIVFVESEIDESGFGFVIPTRITVIVPKLRCGGIKRHAVQGDTEQTMTDRSRFFGDLRVSGQLEVIALRRNAVRITPPRKLTWRVIGPTVGGDETLSSRDGDGHAVGADCCSNMVAGSAGCVLRRPIPCKAANYNQEYRLHWIFP